MGKVDSRLVGRRLPMEETRQCRLRVTRRFPDCSRASMSVKPGRASASKFPGPCKLKPNPGALAAGILPMRSRGGGTRRFLRKIVASHKRGVENLSVVFSLFSKSGNRHFSQRMPSRQKPGAVEFLRASPHRIGAANDLEFTAVIAIGIVSWL